MSYDYSDIELIQIKSEKELLAEFDNFNKLLVDTSILIFQLVPKIQ